MQSFSRSGERAAGALALAICLSLLSSRPVAAHAPPPSVDAGIPGGMRDWVQPSFEYGGRVGAIDYFVTGEYLHNAIGIENPTSSFNAIHDKTDQQRGFAYISGIIDPNTRLTGIFGTSRSQFQIPNVPGMSPGLGLTVNGISDFDSAMLS